MQSLTELKQLTSPFSSQNGHALKAAAAPNNMLGVCSIQDFSGNFGNHDSDLHATYADAQGFYTYLYNWYTANFWFTDGAVQSWLYEEPYDHWQNYYGVDAVLVFYHSGHGAMTEEGVFEAPMGAKWGDESWFLSNHNVMFGNQVSRYIFWSTCFSCRVLDGQNPIKTWWNDDSNPGFRILFGFETVSVDSGDYGKNFWNHWRNGESFSTAWLNASWDINHGQAPSVVASGANQDEANNILFNERFFSWAPVERNWYQWRWYYASSVAARNKTLPKELLLAEFAPVTFDHNHINELAKDLNIKDPQAGFLKDGSYAMHSKDQMVSVNEKGHLNIKLASVNYKNKKQLGEDKALKIAEKYIRQHKLANGEEVQFDMIRLSKTCGSATKEGADTADEYVTDTTVQYKQIINGVSAINQNQGIVSVTIDNDGTVTNMHSSVKKIARLSKNPKSMMIDPSKNGKALAAKSAAAIERSFDDKVSKYKSAKVVEESEETGYDLDSMHGRLVIQRVYEVTFEKGLKKLIKVTVPVFE